jgi:hypothetical protein
VTHDNDGQKQPPGNYKGFHKNTFWGISRVNRREDDSVFPVVEVRKKVKTRPVFRKLQGL